MAGAMAAGFVLVLPSEQCGPSPLVSARRLWRDLQAFCCSQGKCNFHDNSNLNCTLKVRGARATEHLPSTSVCEQHPPACLWMGPRSLKHPESQTFLAACCRWRR